MLIWHSYCGTVNNSGTLLLLEHLLFLILRSDHNKVFTILQKQNCYSLWRQRKQHAVVGTVSGTSISLMLYLKQGRKTCSIASNKVVVAYDKCWKAILEQSGLLLVLELLIRNMQYIAAFMTPMLKYALC